MFKHGSGDPERLRDMGPATHRTPIFSPEIVAILET
jgi:hypothetical protein